MNGPSPTRTTSAAFADCPAATAIQNANAPANVRNEVLSIVTLPCMSSVSVTVNRPWRYFSVHPLLQLDDQCADNRKHDQARENLFCFHNLPGLYEQKAHSALARAADHLGSDDQDNRNSHAELKPGKDAGNRGRNDHLELDLPAIGPKILGRLDQPAIRLADACIGADHDREKSRHGADHDLVELAGTEPDHQQRNEGNLRQRIESRNPGIYDACDETRHPHQNAERDTSKRGDCKAGKDAEQRYAEIEFDRTVTNHAKQVNDNRARRRKIDRGDIAPSHEEFPAQQHR